MYFISRYSKLTEIGLQLPSFLRWFLSAAVLCGVTALWYMCVYSTLHIKLVERARREHSVREQQTVYKTLSQKVDQLEALVNAQKVAWNTTARTMQQRGGHDSLFALFDVFGKQGIALQAYYPRGSVDRGWYTKSSAQIHFAASFDQLLALFDALDGEKVPYHCEQVRLERRDNHIFVTMTVSQKIPKDLV